MTGLTFRCNWTVWAGRVPPLAALGQTGCHAAPSWPLIGCVWASVGPWMCRKFRGEKSSVSGCSCQLCWRDYGRAFSQGEFPQSSCRPGSLVKQICRMWHPRGTHCSERCRNISSCDTLTANLQHGCHYCSIPWMRKPGTERSSSFPKVPSKEAAVLGLKAMVQPSALD